MNERITNFTRTRGLSLSIINDNDHDRDILADCK